MRIPFAPVAFSAVVLIASAWAGPTSGAPGLFSVTLDSAATKTAAVDTAPRATSKDPTAAAAPEKDSSRTVAPSPILTAAVAETAAAAGFPAEASFPKAKVQRDILGSIIGFPAAVVDGAARIMPLRRIATRLLQLGIFLVSLGIIAVTVAFFRRKTERGRFLTTTRLSIMDKEVQRACTYVEDNHANPDLTPDLMCAELVTGRAFLEALFERDLGMSVSEFVNQVRINRARILCSEEPSMSADEIAAATGFRNQPEFLTTFQTVSGSSFENFRTSLPLRVE